jgi:hypothetical protein
MVVRAVLRQFVGFLFAKNFGKLVIFGGDLTEIWIGWWFLSGCGGEFCNLLERHEKELSVGMLEGAREGCCSDEGYLGGLSRGIGLGLRFGIGIGLGIRFRFRFRTGFRFGFGTGFRVGFGIEIRLDNDGTGIVNWGLWPGVKGDCLAVMWTVLLTVRGIESKSGVLPSNSWVVFVKPWFSEDNIMGDVANVQTDRFFVATGLENNGVEMGDRALFRAFTVRED